MATIYEQFCQLEIENAALRAELEEAKELLKPFAEKADDERYCACYADGDLEWECDYCAASRFLSKKDETPLDAGAGS